MPEVESLRRFLQDQCVGHAVAQVNLAAISALKTYDPPFEALQGLLIGAVRRCGKFLALDCDGLFLAFHLARAGWLRWRNELPTTPPRPGRGPLALRVTLDNGSGFELTEAGTQRKLAVYVVTELAQVPGIASLGPDPLDDDFTPEVLTSILAARGRAQLKGVLRDQKLIAGIGNAYSDEILHAARLSPFQPANGLDRAAVAALHEVIRQELTTAIDRAAGLAAKDLKGEKKSGMRVHGRTGKQCPVCGDTVREVSFADSSLQYCPTCQTKGKPLADRRMSRLLK